jgi:hypothetical protein
MAVPESTLRALPYHEALAGYFKTEEPEAWAWFDSAQAQAEHAEALRLELLKQTYRLERDTQATLFAALDEAKTRLGLDIPVTVYQSHHSQQPNAALCFLPGEAHIVFQGGVLQLLDPKELRGLLGHELAHYRLWTEPDGRYHVTDRLTHAMAADPRAEPSHGESARLMRLYTEIYADRGALLVTGDAAAVVSGLVKMHTGLPQVEAASYLRQAEEVFARSKKIRTDELSHPEAFIRARALMLWSQGVPEIEQEIIRMIEGDTSLDKLDLVGQSRMTALTLRWLRLFLRPAWFRTDPVRGHVKQFFPEFDFAPDGHEDEPLLATLREVDASVRDYFCFLLLDFASVDPELEHEPLRAAFALASALGWDERLESLTVKELKLKKREAQRLRAEARGGEAADEKAEVADE